MAAQPAPQNAFSNVGLLTRGLSQQLAEVVAGPPTGDYQRAAASDGADANADDAAQRAQPLTRDNSSRANRERFEQSQRAAAYESFRNACPAMVCFAVVGAVLASIAGIWLWVRGLLVYSECADRPCDQPLKWWLLVALFVPVVWCRANCCMGDNCLKKLNLAVMPALVTVGTWLLLRSKTCEYTNPTLYHFVKMYLIYQAAAWVYCFLLGVGIVTLFFWMHRHGLLDSTPGPATAAKPGLIQEIETVEYNQGAFSDRLDDDDHPNECCICQETFDAERPIKRTPCAHFYHEECLGPWLGRFAKTCPICRTDLEKAVEERDRAAASRDAPV